MLADERTYEEIATEFAQRWGFRRRQAWRHAYGWKQNEIAARYNQLRNDDQASVTEKHISDWENWPRSARKPTPKTLFVLAKIFSTSPSKLIDQADRQNMTADELIELESPQLKFLGENHSGGNDDSKFSESRLVTQTSAKVQRSSLDVVRLAQQTSVGSIHDYIMRVAYESRDHSETAQGNMMPEATLEEITTEVERLTKEHLYSDSLSTFSDTVQARNQVYRFLERQQYPRQTEHLYYLAAILCALLADWSACVGFRRAALEQTRASWAYAEIIGHNSLRLWCRTMQASLDYWSNRPQRALELAISATPWATEPLGRVGLYNSIALFSALTGQHNEARAALVAAFDAHDSSTGQSELFDRIGGMFSYSRAKLLQVSAITYLELDDIDNSEISAAAAVYLYESGPAELRAFGNEASARIDLGHARLLKNDVDGAQEALRPVLELPPAQRLDWVGARLKDFHTRLRGHGISTSVMGRQLGSRIEEFFEVTASDEFPRPDG
jgi:transcriptional regulator with XRE-family HTH domain